MRNISEEHKVKMRIGRDEYFKSKVENKNEMKKTPVVKLRHVLKSGSSYYISIPPEFIKIHGIKKGDRLPVLADNIMMKVIPMDNK